MHKGARALRHGPLFFRFAPTARAMDAALPRPPHGVSVSSALPAQETRLAACSGAYRRTLRPHQPSGGSEGPRGPGRSIVAVGAGRALRSFRSLANIGVLRAGRAQPLYLLTPLGRFGPSAQVSRLLNHSRFPNGRAHGFAAPLRVALRFAQVPTGHTLPFAPQGTHFPPVPGGRGVCARGANIPYAASRPGALRRRARGKRRNPVGKDRQRRAFPTRFTR